MFADAEWLVCGVGRHTVYVWRGYGVVMPTAVTSNGNARIVAEHVVSMVDCGAEVTESALPADTRFDDVESLTIALREFRARMEAQDATVLTVALPREGSR